ncbi:MAG: TlpA family protein disulfide reductase [Bacteroidales bacterium]|nr:TlpA family protein disulfide reductase [Bacteroidales bacterium]
MTFNPKKLVANYFRKKKPLAILSDVVFVVLVALFIIPSTRTDVSAFFIRLTSFAPSTLDAEEQFTVNPDALSWPLYDRQGNKTSFGELNDKPVFLNIWATWCPPCIAELPGIHKLYGDYGDKVNFVLVSNEDPEKVHSFAQEHHYDGLPFYYSASVPRNFSSNSIPTTFILDRNGRILVNKKGAARWNSDTTRELLDKLLNE